MLRLTFTLALVLCLSTFASSNECARYGHRTVKAAGSESKENNEYSTLMLNKLLYI